MTKQKKTKKTKASSELAELRKRNALQQPAWRATDSGRRIFRMPPLNELTLDQQVHDLSYLVGGLQDGVRRLENGNFEARLTFLEERAAHRREVMRRAQKLLQGMVEAGPGLIWNENWLKLVRDRELELQLELQS